MPRFAFLVHALGPVHRGAIGVRSFNPGLFLQWRNGHDPGDISPLCHLSIPGVVEGVVIGIPLLPEDMLHDQQRALDRMVAAVALAGDVDAVGLGSLCAVVAGRGEALAERLSVPVTTGAAATAWALVENVTKTLEPGDGPVGVVGAAGPVGRAVATRLKQMGYTLQLDSVRLARTLDTIGDRRPEAAVAGCSVVVGAGPTGGVLSPDALEEGAILIDVAIPSTTTGPLPSGGTLLAGEALTMPGAWKRGFWGSVYHVLAGYGLQQVLACLVEPLALVVSDRTKPYALGRHVALEDMDDFGDMASSLGFSVKRLPVRWHGR